MPDLDCCPDPGRADRDRYMRWIAALSGFWFLKDMEIQGSEEMLVKVRPKNPFFGHGDEGPVNYPVFSITAPVSATSKEISAPINNG